MGGSLLFQPILPYALPFAATQRYDFFGR